MKLIIVLGEKICLIGKDCEEGKYIKNGETKQNVCYNSCSEILGGLHIYEIGNTCYQETEIDNNNCPYYYLKDDINRICVSHISDCQEAGFYYLHQKECLTNCSDYYKFMDSSLNNITKCYENINTAISDNPNIKYFDQILKECWKDMPPEYFVKYDTNNNQDYFEVVRVCDSFFYEKDTTNHINYCIDNCKDINYFFISDNKECRPSCTKFNKKYFNSTSNECFDTCSGLPGLNFSHQIDIIDPLPQKCLDKCYKNYYITKEDGNGNIIHECVQTCPTGDENYRYIDITTNECLRTCSSDDNHHLVKNKFCYPKCDVENGYVYINTDTYECLKECPNYLKREELLDKIGDIEVKLCKTACKENEYRNGTECVAKCPRDFNYIGHNRVCKQNCNTDEDGQHSYPINEDTYNPFSDYLIYKCISSCSEGISETGLNYSFYTKSNPNKCLRKCPENTNYFYLDSNPYECLSECPKEIPYYDISSSTLPNYHKCSNTDFCTPNSHFLDGVCLNSQECKLNGKEYISSNNICMDKCPEKEIKQKNLDKNNNYEHDGTYTCQRFCDYYIYQENTADEPECILNCPEKKNFIGKNNVCKKSCGIEEGINFYELNLSSAVPPVNYSIYKCIKGCVRDYHLKEYNNENHQCYKECTEAYPYLSLGEHLCFDICHKSTQMPYTLDYKDSTGSIISKTCSNECVNDGNNINIYFGENKVCIDNCNLLENSKIIDINNRCVEKCNYTSTYRFQLNEKCEEKCEVEDGINPNPKKRYSTTDYICKEKCDTNENIVIEGNQCFNICDAYLNALNPDEYECIPSCLSINKFYYPIDNICLPSCHDNDIVVEDTKMCVSSCNELTNKKYFLYKTTGTDDQYPYDTCVLKCPINKPYIYDDECVEICPDDKRYFQNEFTHGEDNMNKICLTDCPEDYPYYNITEDEIDSNKKYYGCKAKCNTCIIPKNDESIVRILCLNTFPEGNYKYILETETNNIITRRCYENCPLEAKYHFDIDPPTNSPDHNCYDTCPEESPYHEIGLTVCKKQSEFINGGYILYDIKEWVDRNSMSKCPDDYTLYSKTEDPNPLVICLYDCIYEYNNEKYFYLTPFNTCVKNCSSTTSDLVSGKNFINDEIHKRCICENLFYIEETTSQTICYENSIGKDCKELIPLYPLRLNGTNQCLKSCDNGRILNPSEDICYEKDTQCSKVDLNSKLITKSNWQKKCDCAYKFYFNGDQKYCLREGSVCPEKKKFYIPDTMECIEQCPPEYKYNYHNFCFNQCPFGSVVNEVDKTCNCGIVGIKFGYKQKTVTTNVSKVTVQMIILYMLKKQNNASNYVRELTILTYSKIDAMITVIFIQISR